MNIYITKNIHNKDLIVVNMFIILILESLTTTFKYTKIEIAQSILRYEKIGVGYNSRNTEDANLQLFQNGNEMFKILVGVN